MREILRIPLFTAKRRCLPFPACLVLSVVALLATFGCTIKKTIKIDVPQKILQAKTAGFEELLGMLQRYDRIHSVSSSLEVEYFSGKKESGVIQEIKPQPGYILLRRPNSTRLVVQNFVTKTRELEVLSVEDDLSIYYRRDNALYVGKNSAKNLIAENRGNSSGITVPIRGEHIYEAIIPQSIQIDAPGFLYSMEEASDLGAKYYVLSVYRENATKRIHAVRKIWIERSSLAVARQQVYLDEGQLVSDILYSDETEVDGLKLPLRIHIDRPLDGYALNLEFKSWRIDPDLPDNAFSLKLPEGVQVIHLIEK
jgi:outer membrane lipoprotein-sorting protein